MYEMTYEVIFLLYSHMKTWCRKFCVKCWISRKIIDVRTTGTTFKTLGKLQVFDWKSTIEANEIKDKTSQTERIEFDKSLIQQPKWRCPHCFWLKRMFLCSFVCFSIHLRHPKFQMFVFLPVSFVETVFLWILNFLDVWNMLSVGKKSKPFGTFCSKSEIILVLH